MSHRGIFNKTHHLSNPKSKNVHMHRPFEGAQRLRGGGSICECGRGKHLPAQADKEPVRGVQSRQARTSPCRRISTSFEFEPHLLLPAHTCSVLGCDSLGVIPSQVSQTDEVQGGGRMCCSVYNRLPACAFLILATGTWSQGGRQ